MATIGYTNVPVENLSVNDFMSVLNKFGGPAKQCRYMAKITPSVAMMQNTSGILSDLMYLCDATELPGRSFEVYETRYYGPTIALPYNTKYTQELSMSFITRHKGSEREFFDNWLNMINPVSNFDFEYPENYYCRIDIFQYREYGEYVRGSGNLNGQQKAIVDYVWTLHNAWPATVTPQPVTWADNDVLRLSVSFIYQYWSRPGLDRIPGSSLDIIGLEPGREGVPPGTVR